MRVLAVANLSGQAQQFQHPASLAICTDAFEEAGRPGQEPQLRVLAHGWRVLVAQ